MSRPAVNQDRAARLRDAREAAGYVSATAAAREHFWAPSTYLGHENGSRGIGVDEAIVYAEAFKCDWAWLATGRSNPAPAASATSLDAPIERQPSDVAVPAQPEIQIYRNAAGAVVIKMDGGGIYDEDQFVIIQQPYLDVVVDVLTRVKAEALPQ